MNIDNILASHSGNVVVVNNHGGHGHKSTTELLEKRIQEKNSQTDSKIHSQTKEIFQFSLGRCLGTALTNSWNRNQKRENIRKINMGLILQGFCESFVYLPIFFSFIRLFAKNHTEVVISPQHIGLKPMSAALRLMNCWNRRFHPERKPMTLRIIMTEFPTKDATNYLGPLKALSRADWKNIELFAPSPLLAEGQSKADFWIKHAGIPKNLIDKVIKNHEFLPVRKPFLELENIENIHEVPLNYANPEELAAIYTTSGLDGNSLLVPEKNGLDPSQNTNAQSSLTLKLSENDNLTMLMLGSQSPMKSTLKYISSLAEKTEGKQRKNGSKEIVTVLCSRNKKLFRKVIGHVDSLKQQGKLPPNFHVVPLLQQEAESVAHMMYRSDTTISKSGGITAMELLAVIEQYKEKFGKSKEVLIHSAVSQNEASKILQKNISEEKKEKYLQKMAYKGIIRMETGNFSYLKDHIDAKLTTPYLIHPVKIPSKSHMIISRIVIGAMKAIANILLFPLRFVGSKTWSFPGLVLRTPWLLFKTCILKKKISKKELVGAGYHHSINKKLPIKKTNEALKYASYSIIPYRYDEKDWTHPFNGHIVSPKDLNIDCKQIKGKMQLEEHAFIDFDSTFKAVVLEDDNELVVSFGAYQSSKLDISDKKKRKKFSRKQLMFLTSTTVGVVPKMFVQADQFVKQLSKIAENKGKKLVLNGISLGASLATYAALKNRKKAFCFNPVPLGPGLQYHIGTKKLSNADKYVTRISVRNDITSDLKGAKFLDLLVSSVGIRTVGNFGKPYWIPSVYKDIKRTHALPIHSLMAYLGHPKESKASNVIHA